MTRAIKYYEVLFKSVPHTLSYQSTPSIPIGSLVKTMLNKKSVQGIVLKQGKNPQFKCENIEAVLIPEALSPLQLNLASWMSQYYFAPLSKCVALFVPPVIWNGKRQPKRDKNGELLNPDKDHPSKPYHGEPLTREQKKVLNLIHGDTNTQNKSDPNLGMASESTNRYLIHGITGSGKTEIYLQLIKKMIQQDQQTVLLVPEIALTSELIRHFSGHFPDQISIIHSRISEGARLQSWHRILEGKTKIILGSRSALFTPWRNLGAIIIDEEHEWTYKSEQTPRYHTRTVAEKIVELEAGPILLLGSATPSIETYFNASGPLKNSFSRVFCRCERCVPKRTRRRRGSAGQRIKNLRQIFMELSISLLGDALRRPSEGGPSELIAYSSRKGVFQRSSNRYSILSLPFRATSEPLPRVTVVDLRQEFQKKNLSMISDSLASAITDRLLKKEQVILFLNKRGAASCVICRDCGFTPRCKRCDLAMTYHLKLNRSMEPLKKGVFQRFHNPSTDGLLCHSCGSTEPTPLACPLCKSLAIRYVGSGTQKLHLQLQSMFPQARILRADKDTASGRHAFEHIYQKMWTQEADILLGTQMITKGLDLPNVTLVGIVIADIGLHIPDFRASERVFQLLMQVSGRSGRHKPGEVIIQTYQPEHPAVVAASNHDYQGFYEQEIHNREQFFYPPFLNLIRLTYAHKDPKRAEDETKKLFQQLSNLAIQQSSSLQATNYKLQPILDLSPHYIPRLHNKWIWNILLRGQNPRRVLENLALNKGWKIDVDPV